MSTAHTLPEAVWLFAGGPMQRRVAEAIKRRGYKLILTDGNSECTLSAFADEFVHLDTFDSAANIERGQRLKECYVIKAVLTVAADCHETVANVARSLECPHIDPVLSHRCRFKYETRRILTEAGIPQPVTRVASTHEEALALIEEVGLPLALKATDSSGSRGFARIATLTDFTEEVFLRALQFGTSGKVILEELLIPVDTEIAEQSVETLWFDGEMRWLNWVDRLFRKDFVYVEAPWSESENPYTGASWAVELAHVNPAVHEESLRKDVEEMIRQAGLALGMHVQKGGHILKADIMLTTKGPIILELTPRLSGGWDSSFSTPARGADFAEGALALALGERVTSALIAKYFTFATKPAFSAVLTRSDIDAEDCIGRDFAGGVGSTRKDAIADAAGALKEGTFLT